MVLESLITPEEFFRQTIEKVNDKINRHTVPLFYFKKGNNTPQQLATAVLVDISGTKYLLTASHVFDAKVEIFLLFKEWMQPLNGLTCILDSKKEKDSSLVDISICKLHESVIEKLNESSKNEFYKLDKITYLQPLVETKSYVFLGYPYRKTKLNVPDKLVMPKRYAISTEPSDKKYYEKYNFSESHNIIVNYRRRRQGNFKKGIVQGPKLDGCSGCGLWYIPNIVNLNDKEPDYYLKGILTEWIREDSIVVCQNIKFIINCFESKFNEKIIT